MANITITIRQITKSKLDENRDLGQCYNEFINELVDYWERYRIGSSLCSLGRPIRREIER
jgi:hypothetical protein